jgi:hypothetical protein
MADRPFEAYQGWCPEVACERCIFGSGNHAKWCPLAPPKAGNSKDEGK